MVMGRERKREREARQGKSRSLESVLRFRVLFSLHFSCITSMAIVYVNFDVSAKVVKCEVLDVLIALCRREATSQTDDGPRRYRKPDRLRAREGERGRRREIPNYRHDR